MNDLERSKYGKYVQERLDAKILENEFGFIVYQIKGNECFILEMFIEEGYRSKGKGAFLCAELSNIAHEAGAKALTANIFLFDKSASVTLMAALKIGFRVVAANNGCITIFRGIGG